MRGRKPVGPEGVERLQGSAQAKERLRVVLETLAGNLRVQQACTQLGIGEVRFHQLRQEVLQGALAALEPRPGGRPPKTATPVPAEQVTALEQRLEQLEQAQRTAQVREEIALARLIPTQTPPPAEKKTTRRRRKRS